MSTRIRTVGLAAAAALVAGTAFAQGAAPRGNPSVAVGGKKLSVEYGQPALNGRPLDELMKSLPEDRMWRTGSEQVTTLTSEGDVTIGGAKLPAGKYSLYVHVGEDGTYSLAVNSALGQPLGKIWAAAPENLKNEPWPHFNYAKEIAGEEMLRVPMHKHSLSAPKDRFEIALEPAGDGATMTLAWGDQAWSVDVKPAS